jgi:hypothetical protein
VYVTFYFITAGTSLSATVYYSINAPPDPK